MKIKQPKNMRPNVKEFREFLRTVCVVSAMMASISFVGVSILISIYSPSGVIGSEVWNIVAYVGVAAVYVFAIASINALRALDPYAKKWSKGDKGMKKIRRRIWQYMGIGWAFFFILIAGLLFTFR